MVQLETWPSEEVLQKLESATPEYMHPNRVPHALIAEGFVPPEKCDEIVDQLNPIDGFKYEGCNATTREVGQHPVLSEVRDFTHWMNAHYWEYILDAQSYTWMQTYINGDEYHLHMDASPGRMRKLTAVVFLTDPREYKGGDLEIYFHPTSKMIPRTRGTVVIFQPWLLHQVFPIISGMRQSLNMSFWGPNFR